MASDDDVRALFGRDAPWPSAKCGYCGTHLRIMGLWHPEGYAGAYAVYGCPACKSTFNGGRT